MKKNLPILALTLLALTACGSGSSSAPSSSVSESSVVSSSSAIELSSKSSEKDLHVLPSDVKDFEDDLIWYPEQKIEVGQRQYLKNFLIENSDSKIYITDPEMLEIDGDYLIGKKQGESEIVYYTGGKYQKIKVSIAEQGTYKRAYNFVYDDLKDKKLCAFGDSVTADATIGDTESVYPRRFATKFGMNFVANYAVGGTTGTYGKFNTNVNKEYGSTNYINWDGPSLVYSHLKDKSLTDIDYMFISFGYNDTYFQCPIDAEGDDESCTDGTFANCHSFKGSYRYMIDCARKANPKMQIILLTLNYNQYNPDFPKNFPSNYSYDKGLRTFDYRKAIYEIGYEKDVKVIDTYAYMESLFDLGKAQSVNQVYKDFVHLTKFGQKKLADFIYKW